MVDRDGAAFADKPSLSAGAVVADLDTAEGVDRAVL